MNNFNQFWYFESVINSNPFIYESNYNYLHANSLNGDTEKVFLHF